MTLIDAGGKHAPEIPETSGNPASSLPDAVSIRSSDKQAIVDALDPDVVRRMRNWVDWLGYGSTSCSSSWCATYGVRLDRYPEARIPVLVAEAQRTDAAVKAIPDELGQAVALFWLGGEDTSFVEMGCSLGCSDKTCKARILRGHVLLTVEVYRRQAIHDASAQDAALLTIRTSEV